MSRLLPVLLVLGVACTSSSKESAPTHSGADSAPTDDTQPTDDTEPTDDSEPLTDDSEPPTEDEDAEWGYDGDIGPEHWGSLDEDYATCDEGLVQSPINLTEDLLVEGYDPLTVLWSSTAIRAYNSGHYIRYEVDEGSSYVISNEGRFDLDQFHFHSLSEHTVDGQHAAMEAHFVHYLDTNPDRALVVTFLMDPTGESDTDLFGMEGALKFHQAVALPESETPTDLGGTIDLNELGELFGRAHLSYEGSLTTPACTEGVRFYISGAILAPEIADIEAFTAVYDHNYRPTQPLNGRSVTAHSGEPG